MTKKQNKEGGGTTEITSTVEEHDDPPVEESDQGEHSSSDNDGGSDDDEEEELIAAAAAWANQTDNATEGADESKKTGSKKSSSTVSLESGNKKLSLHITQLPYDTNELDLRRLFAEQGCRITSIRLVFDHDEKGRKTVFRGVAFVDLLDNESYEKALAMNRKTSIRGRKLNIRPTRSKEELADIVSRTKELVQEKIKEQLGHKDGGHSTDCMGGTGTDKKARKKLKKKEKKDRAKAAKAKTNGKITKHKTAARKEEGGTAKPSKEVKKLTKKERNRKAAILMSMRKKK
mmetsp:Transcript_103696/g.299935  ORF Transcript_103696/g.299935 Transcript_103696/m.299935 type:complete len:289 (+) Transcript_103696:179-1045(+)